MKKVLILLIAGFLLLPFTGCDTGTSPSNPVNPVQPAVPTLESGSLVLTIADPGVTPDYDDSNNPYAVITGSTAGGSTFSQTVDVPYGGSGLVTLNNLIPGTWNIKVKVWDDLYDGDGLEDVVALGYETVSIVTDAPTNLTVDLNTQDDVNEILSATNGVYDSFSVSSSEDVRYAFSWGIYFLFAYDEEMALDALATGDLSDMKECLSFITNSDSFTTLFEEVLDEYDDYLKMTYKQILDYVLEEEQTAEYYSSFFFSMISAVGNTLFGDFNPLYYDLIDLTVTGLAKGDILSDTGSVSVSVSSDYAAQGTYTWVMNGSVVGTGSSYTLSGADCVEGLNLLSVQYSYEDLVILGSENVVFYRETTVQRLLISDIDFKSDIVKDAALATGLAYADDVKIMGIVADENSLDYGGIQYLVNLQSLIIISGGNFSGSDFLAMEGLSNLTTIYFRYDWPSDTILSEIQRITPQTVTFVSQLITP